MEFILDVETLQFHNFKKRTTPKIGFWDHFSYSKKRLAELWNRAIKCIEYKEEKGRKSSERSDSKSSNSGLKVR